MLRNCYFILELGVNIISQLYLKSTYSIIRNKKVSLYTNNNKLIAQGQEYNGLYYIRTSIKNKINLEIVSLITKNIEKTDTIDLYIWHKRLGYISYKVLERLINKSTKKYNINKESIIKIKNCEECIKAKATNKINKESFNKEYKYLEKITIDIQGPCSIKTFNKYKYFLTILDISTRYLHIYLLEKKLDALKFFKEYKLEVENNPKNIKIKEVFLDNAKEFIYSIKEYYKTQGIIYNTSLENTLEPRGKIERINRTLLKKIRAILFIANLLKYLQG